MSMLYLYWIKFKNWLSYTLFPEVKRSKDDWEKWEVESKNDLFMYTTQGTPTKKRSKKVSVTIKKKRISKKPRGGKDEKK